MTPRISYYLSEELIRLVEKEASRLGISRSAVVKMALIRYLREAGYLPPLRAEEMEVVENVAPT